MADAENTFDLSTLWSLVPIDDSVRNLSAGEELSVDDVVEELRARLMAGADNNYDLPTGVDSRVSNKDQNVYSKESYSAGRGVANVRYKTLDFMLTLIAEALPRELRNKGVLQRIDVRPIFLALGGKTVSYNGSTFEIPATAAQAYADAETYFQRTTAENTLQNVPLEERNQLIEESLDYGTTVGTTSNIIAPDPAGGTTGSWIDDPAAKTVSLAELRELFIERGGNDILQLESLIAETGMVGVEPAVGFTAAGPPVPGAAAQPGLSFNTPASMNYRAAANYLYTGGVTPSEVTRLQRNMVAAGLFDVTYDGTPASYVAGDVLDATTNRAWQRLLGEAYRRNMTVPATLKMLTDERNQRSPDLASRTNRRVMNVMAQQLIGRNLTDAEESAMISYLKGMGAREGFAAREVDPALGFSEQEVSTFVAERMPNAIESVELGEGANNFSNVLRGMV